MSAQRMGSVLRRLRTQRHLTQIALGKKARVSQGYLAKLERGERINPNLAVLKRIEKALRVPVTLLLM